MRKNLHFFNKWRSPTANVSSKLHYKNEDEQRRKEIGFIAIDVAKMDVCVFMNDHSLA